MSWIEQSQESLVITTGDGKSYTPKWKATEKIIEYNVSQFEFPGVKGSIVHKRKPKGRKFPLEIYFDGDLHLQNCEEFEKSAEDERHWVVNHPFYGIFNANPSSINIDHSQSNVSKLMINLLETIVEDNPKGLETPTELILSNSVIAIDSLGDYVDTSVTFPSTLDKNQLSQNVTTIYNEGKKTIKEASDIENYFNLFNEAIADILNVTDDLSQAMVTAQAMINAPFQFIDTVKNRVNMLKNQFLKLVTSVVNLVSPSSKRIYEHNSGVIIICMAEASVTSPDYASSEDVLNAIADLLDFYDQYILTLDSLQTDNGGDPDSYIPNAGTLLQIQDIIDYTVSKLFEIALDSKQERSIITETDTNVITLAHRLYGLEPDDSTIDYLVSTNNLGMDDLLQISAGRKIKYYV